eukprot:Skav233328  [mRNA]  locus=scaffold2479:11034:11285:- [translate_table: standard]
MSLPWMRSHESTRPIAERTSPEMVAERQTQCWVKIKSTTLPVQLTSMRLTNLGQPKGCRNRVREQGVKFQDQWLIPDVPVPLK